MERVHNFGAGPCTLPLSVLEDAAAEFVDFRGAGLSILEMSHRAPAYDEIHAGTIASLRRLYGLSDDWAVLLLGGGATLQFAMVPLNLMPRGGRAAYALTGAWARKAAADAAKLGEVTPVFDGAPDHAALPDPASLTPPADAAYLHLTSNETIGGLQWPDFPETGAVPLVCDMSSDFVSRRVPVERFGLIYAGAQKNAGPAGATAVLVRRDLLERVPDDLPAYLRYAVHAAKDSLYNTPPVFSIYMMGKTLAWLEDQGGLEAAERLSAVRSALVYDAVEGSGGFYRSPIDPAARSRMNVVFRLPTADLEARFVAAAADAGMIGLKGHRSVGGCRASLYNALPVAAARALADFMGEFARVHG